MTLSDTLTPLVIQPDRLMVPRSTRVRYQALFALDGLFLLIALGLLGGGVTVGGAAGTVMFFIAAMMGVPGVIGLDTGTPSYRALNLTERRRLPLLFGHMQDSFVVLTPGPHPKRSRELLVVPGAAVTVDVAPDLRHSLFYVVIALKWTISSGGRSTRFTTYFEPDPQFFNQVGEALAAVGLQPVFTYRPLSHSVLFADM